MLRPLRSALPALLAASLIGAAATAPLAQAQTGAASKAAAREVCKIETDILAAIFLSCILIAIRVGNR